jgi:hypothetical protein
MLTMFKRIAFLALAGAVIVAGAAQAHPGKHGKTPHPVPYLLAGTVVSTQAADATAGTPASIIIVVKHSNRHGRALKNQQITLTLSDTTRLWKRGKGKATLDDFVAGDRVHAKAWAPRGAMPTDQFNARWVRDYTKAAAPTP